MREDWALTPSQTFFLTFAWISGPLVVSLPTILAKLSGQDGWLAALVALPAGVVPLLLWYALEGRLPGKTFTEQSLTVLGPTAGMLLGLLPLVLFASTLPVIVRNFADLVAGTALPRTPLPFVMGLVLLPTVYVVRSGLEVLARLGEILVPTGLIALFVILFASVKDTNLVNLLPVLARGPRPVLQGAGSVAGWYAESFLISYVGCFRGRGRGQTLWAANAGLAVAGAALAVATALTTAVFGPLEAIMVAPVFQQARTVDIADFITHVDPVLLVAWTALGFVKMGVWYYCFCLALTQWLRLRDYRPLTLPIAAFAVVGGMAWFDSGTGLSAWLSKTWPFWGMGLQVLPPLILWALAVLRGASETQRRAPAAENGL